MTAPGDRPLVLHECIDIVGRHQWDDMERAKRQAGHEKVDFELLGSRGTPLGAAAPTLGLLEATIG